MSDDSAQPTQQQIVESLSERERVFLQRVLEIESSRLHLKSDAGTVDALYEAIQKVVP